MKKLILAVVCAAALCASCGGKIDEMKKTADAMQQLSKKGEEMSNAAEEGEKVYKERAAKGDTVAMPYKELQGFFPSSVSGYKLEGEPSGSQQSMTGFSISQAQQQWVNDAGDARVTVQIADWGGTQSGYGMASAALAMGFNSEDDKQRTESLKLDVPTTNGVATFNKQDKSATVLVGTRYRYLITISSTGAKDDQTSMLKDVATEVAKKFEGK
jgi:hypothetical protein